MFGHVAVVIQKLLNSETNFIQYMMINAGDVGHN